MKAEHGFNHHVDGSDKIVAAAHMAELMGENAFQMQVREMLGDSHWPEKHGTKDAEDARFHGGMRVKDGERVCESRGCPEFSKQSGLSAFGLGVNGSCDAGDATPPGEPEAGDNEESGGPDENHGSEKQVKSRVR